MVSRVLSGNISGLSVDIVSVEVDVSAGIPMIEMGGILSTEVKEAIQRVKVALKNAGFNIKPEKIVINISPADIKKCGTGYDLPIAIGILAANGYIDLKSLENVFIMGELALDGSVVRVKGILPCIIEAKKNSFVKAFIPEKNLGECIAIEGIDIYGCNNIKDLVKFLNNDGRLKKVKFHTYENILKENKSLVEDFSDIAGQKAAIRASLIAASGGHNILFVGPPGCGKTMMAKRIVGILPQLTFEDSLEVSKIYSIIGELAESEIIVNPPYRAPHHTVTHTALIGGKNTLKPGELTLANKGVLFLDELTEFKPQILDTLRQPLEDRYIVLSRNNINYTYPCDIILVAATNPCKCGYYPDRQKCSCSEEAVKKYMGKISKPLLERFDLCVSVSSIKYGDLDVRVEKRAVNSKKLREKVINARKIQYSRNFGKLNAKLSNEEIYEACKLGDEEKHFLEKVFEKLNLSARAYYKILKVARTIADIEESENVKLEHLGEAVTYRI